MREYLAAFTPATDKPAYISINYEHGVAGNYVEVTVRSPVKANGDLGDVAAIKMSCKEWAQLWNDALHHFQAIQLMAAEGEFSF